MSDKDLYRELGILTRNRSQWKDNIGYVASLLTSDSVKIIAKALWLLGEMGYAYPDEVVDHVPSAAAFCSSPEPLLRERAVNALGRIGRSGFHLIEPYWEDLFRFASDEEAGVRLSFIWASENIATNTPEIYGDRMDIFAGLLYDPDDRVRIEAPEIFRVVGKRKPEFVRPYIGKLQTVAETDGNSIVRIHCLGAVKASVQQ